MRYWLLQSQFESSIDKIGTRVHCWVLFESRKTSLHFPLKYRRHGILSVQFTQLCYNQIELWEIMVNVKKNRTFFVIQGHFEDSALTRFMSERSLTNRSDQHDSIFFTLQFSPQLSLFIWLCHFHFFSSIPALFHSLSSFLQPLHFVIYITNPFHPSSHYHPTSIPSCFSSTFITILPKLMHL